MSSSLSNKTSRPNSILNARWNYGHNLIGFNKGAVPMGPKEEKKMAKPRKRQKTTSTDKSQGTVVEG